MFCPQNILFYKFGPDHLAKLFVLFYSVLRFWEECSILLGSKPTSRVSHLLKLLKLLYIGEEWIVSRLGGFGAQLSVLATHSFFLSLGISLSPRPCKTLFL